MDLIIIYVLITVVISGMCSVLESALLSTPLSYVTTLESKNHPKAKRLRQYKDDIDRPISAILTLNTIANTAGAALVGAQAAQVFGSTYVGVVSALFTLLILIFSEIIPKTIGAEYWRNIILPASSVIRVLIIITYPLVVLLEWITGLFTSDSRPAAVSREEVSAMVTVGAEEGVLEKKENKMIQHLLKLDEITAEEIMTPSVVVDLVNEKMTVREFYKKEEYSKHSRIPVYTDTDDYVSGYVLRQAVLERLAEDKFNTTLAELARPILTFEEETPVSEIWESLLEKKEQISAIIDEYGGFRGLVTMEDVIETMLGFEIVDERDSVVDMQELAIQQWQKQKRKIHRRPATPE
ncbi:MAG: HlyC/CorC family transporter [Bacteroidaceae bacterium]|nr:HlyC/CorC family transporter [Bacteroidaceae bacterium]